jgi:hypothetical protein
VRSTLHTPRTRKRGIAAATIAALALISSFLVAAPAQALNDTGTGGVFVPVAGARIVDSTMTGKQWKTVQVAGKGGVPSDGSAGAVSVVATLIGISNQGILTGRPNADEPSTTMGIYGGENKQNTSFSAVLAVNSDGTIQVSAETNARLLLDVQGYYTANTDGTAPGGFVPMNGSRIVDTRSGTGAPKAALPSGKTVDVQVGGVAGVPKDASAVIINMIAANTGSTSGYFTPYATGSTRPPNSFNYAGGGVATSMQAQVKLSSAGKLTVFNQDSTADLLLDVQGYFTAAGKGGAVFTPGAGRAYDTRTSGNTVMGKNETRSIQIAGKAGVPVMGSGINAVVLTLTSLKSTAGSGNATVWADGTTRPNTTSINFDETTIRTNTITVPLGANGKVSLSNVADATNYVLDVQGWYADPSMAAINCASYAAGSWSTTIPATVDCTVTAPAASATGQAVQISAPGSSQTVALGTAGATSNSVSFAPIGGENPIYATVLDDSGNVINENVYTLGFGDWAAAPLSATPDAGAHVTPPVVLSVAAGNAAAFRDDVTFAFSVSDAADMGNVVWSATSAAQTVSVPSGVLGSGATYYWTVTAAGSTDWSGTQKTSTTSPQSFTTDGAVTPLTTDQESDVRSRMNGLGIDSGTQDALVAKLNTGATLDSSIPGTTPVQTVTNTNSDGQADSTLVFADGSRSNKTLEAASVAAPAGTQVRTSKSGCSKSSGWYVNCKIGVSDPISNASFLIDYQTSSKGKAQVRDIRQIKCVAYFGASCSRSGSVKRATQSSKGPAWAAESYTYKSPFNIVQGGSDFGIRVSGTNVSLY